MTYFGEGFDKGHCGVIIKNAKEINNGNFTCNLTPAEGMGQEIDGTMRLTVASK